MTREPNAGSSRRHRAIRIGVTGPIGCGKSTVAGWLGERPGVAVIDADQVARDVLDRGEPGLDAVVGRFGPGVLRSDGALDRTQLGRIVFADPAALRDLEAIVHPTVRPRILTEIARADEVGASAIVIEAIKLVAGGLATECDEVWLITCDPAAQRARLIGRGASPADAAQRIDAQGDLISRLAPAATRTIDTSGGLADVRRLADTAFDEALQQRAG